jgi:hypothetical protein
MKLTTRMMITITSAMIARMMRSFFRSIETS